MKRRKQWVVIVHSGGRLSAGTHAVQRIHWKREVMKWWTWSVRNRIQKTWKNMGNMKEVYEIMGDKAKTGRDWFGWVCGVWWWWVFFFGPSTADEEHQVMPACVSTKGSDTSYNVYTDTVATGCCRCSMFTWVQWKCWEFQGK